MKAAFQKGQSALLKEVPVPPVGGGELRIQVEACGICGTDLHERADLQDTERPFGHEIAGRVVEVGLGVTGLEPGRRVVLESSSACGRCPACRNARQELCSNVQDFWAGASLGLAEQIVCPSICAVPCDGLQPEVACLSEPLAVAIDMVRLAEISMGSNVLIMGAGPIGLMALALVRRAGARRIFFGAHAHQTRRWELAGRFGADIVMDPGENPLADFDFGCGIDRILVTTPPNTLPAVFDAACKGAVISFVGIAHGDGAGCTFDANAFHFKKLQLRGSFASPALYTPLALQVLREGVVDGAALISHRFGLDEIAPAMAMARNKVEAVKVVVLP